MSRFQHSNAAWLARAARPLDGSSTGQVDMDRLDLCVVGQSVFSQFSSYTGLLESTERYVVVQLVVA